MFIDLSAGEGVAVALFLGVTLAAFVGAVWAGAKAFGAKSFRWGDPD